ncbi:MAG: 50S ribosomal protein L25/general stress protein Ctc [Deltaproteobacteria bacterium]|nr:50S ribosomal protein L25/general stress protein Ctc [Deltaproteobacteria bacterium]
MEQRELEVFLRTEKGKGAAHRIRREGKIPAVLYGRAMETYSLSLNPEELKKILTSGARENTLIGLRMIGPGSEKIGNRVVMLKDLQVHPIKRNYLHADFYAVAMDEKIEVEVPIHLTGKAEGTKSGGILEQPRREVRVRCLPTDIPEFIEVDVSGLQIGDSLHVQDIRSSSKFEIVAETNFTVASVTPPISEAKYEEIVAAPEAEREIAQPERVGEKKEETEEAKETKEAKGAKEGKE